MQSILNKSKPRELFLQFSFITFFFLTFQFEFISGETVVDYNGIVLNLTALKGFWLQYNDNTVFKRQLTIINIRCESATKGHAEYFFPKEMLTENYTANVDGNLLIVRSEKLNNDIYRCKPLMVDYKLAVGLICRSLIGVYYPFIWVRITYTDQDRPYLDEMRTQLRNEHTLHYLGRHFDSSRYF